MDFHKLLQKASAKQKVVEKKHVEDKVKKNEEKRKRDTIVALREREANEKLKRLKESAERRKLEYKGLHVPGKALPPPESGHSSKSSGYSSNPLGHSSKSSVHSSKSSSHSSKPNSTATSTIKKSDGKRTKSSTDVKSKPHKAPPKPPPPSNFNDLMKMAKQKKTNDKSEYPPRSGNSPLGKSLLERAAAKNSKSRTPPVTRPPASHKPLKSGAPDRQSSQQPSSSNGHASPSNMKPQAHCSRHLPGASGLSKTELARRAALHKKKTQPAAKPTAFYGSAASRILGVKSGGGFGGRYTSTWVDEMREEIGDVEDLYSDEDDDLDLEGFVVDGEDEADDEYSSHIRKIFGYDRRRFADDQYDDRVMESSFAQQEFEEQRSARIGKQEDIEDIQREQKELARKRKRKASPPRPYGASRGKLKQAKLSYR